MAKVINQTIEISVCAQDSYSPVKLSQTIELAPNEQFVPQEVERWCLDHLTALALEYARKIQKEVAPQEQTPPQIIQTVGQPQNPQMNQMSQMNSYNQMQSHSPSGTSNYNYNQPNYGGGQQSEMDMLLNTNIPKNLFGKTKPAGFATYGLTLRACSNKELNYLAYQCNASKNTTVGYNAQRLLSLGYQGL